MTGIELVLVLAVAGVMAARSRGVRSGVARAGRVARFRLAAPRRGRRAGRVSRRARGLWAWGRRAGGRAWTWARTRRTPAVPDPAADGVAAPPPRPVAPAAPRGPVPRWAGPPEPPGRAPWVEEPAPGVRIDRLAVLTDRLDTITTRLGEHMDEIRRANAAIQATGRVTPELLPDIIGHALAMGTELMAWTAAMQEYIEFLESAAVGMDRRYTRMLFERTMGVLGEAAGLRADIRLIMQGYAAELAVAEGETGHQRLNPAVLGGAR